MLSVLNDMYLAMSVDHEVLSKRLHKVNYEAHHEEALGRRCDKTVQWLLQNSEYLEWKNPHHQPKAIWLHGEVGSGKTVAVASLIEDLQGERRAIVGPGYRPLVLYFFCDGKEAAKAETSNVVEVLLRQILVQFPSVGYEMSRSIRKVGGQFSLTLSNGIRILQEALSSVPKVFLIIDALDECTGGKEQLLDALLGAAKDLNHLRLLVTTRSHPGRELRPVFEKWTHLLRQISLAEEYVRGDIDIFLGRQIDQSSDIKFLNRNLKDTVRNTIKDQACGIFLWASIAWEMFLSSSEEWSEVGVENRLEMLLKLGEGGSDSQQSIPNGQQKVSLYGLYEAILKRVPNHDKSRTRRLFLLMVFAQTPLTLEELRIASALEPVHTSLDSVTGNLHVGEFENAVRSMCCPLVKIIRGNSTVMLVHQSVKEYFLEGDHHHRRHSYALKSEEAHLVYSVACLTFLGFADFANTAPYTTAPQTSEIDLRDLESRPFLRYSALHWATHVAQVQFRPEIWEGFLRLTQSGTALVYAFRLFWYTGGKGPFPPDTTPMDILCYMGLDLLVEKAFSEKKEPDGSDLAWAQANAFDSIGRTALHWGASNGHTNVVRILLENGGNPNVEARLEDDSTFTPLTIAAEYGHVEVMKLLMRDTSGDIERGRLLELAAVGGHTEVMEALTASGVDVNVIVGDRSALHAAAFQDHIESVRWLLENGANVNLNDPRHGTPLQVAAYEGNLEIVKLLLDNNADPNLGNGVYGSPLHAAAFRDWKDVARVLIEGGADVKAKVGDYGTVVNAARTNGHTTMVSFLQSFGAPTRAFSAPLRRASILDEPSMYGVALVEQEIKKGRMPGLEKRKKKFIQGLLSAVEDGNKRRLEVMLQIGLNLFKMAVRSDREGFQVLIVKIATMILLEAVKQDFHNGITTMTTLYTSALTFVLDEGKPLLVEKLLSECVKDFNGFIDDGKDNEAKTFEVAAIEVILTVVEAGNEQLIEIVADKWMEAFEGVIGGRFGSNLLSVIGEYGLKWVSAVEQQENNRVMLWGRTAAEVLSAAASGRKKQVSRALSTQFSQTLQSVFDKSKDSAGWLSEECLTQVSQIPMSEISAQRLARLWMLALEFLLATERGGRHGRDCKESQEAILELSRSFLQAADDSDRLVAVIQITHDVFSEKIQDCKDDISLSLLKKDMSSVIDTVIGMYHGTELEKMLNGIKDDILAAVCSNGVVTSSV